jgi:hypothetical protein
MRRACREINPLLPANMLLAATAHFRSPSTNWRSDMTHPTVKLGLPLLLVLATGCTTMGTGFGSTASGTDPVNFSWKSSNGLSGTMNAAVPNGISYTGQFFQITSDTTVDNLGPLWAGWGPGWRGGGWDYWDAEPEFVTHYTGKVVANLSASDGKHMRCTFQLALPSDGMAGGGTGQCQMPDGKTIDTSFPAAS